MIKQSCGIDETRLGEWIEHSLASGTHSLAAGYQGQTLKYVDDRHRLVIKVPHGSGPFRYFHTRLLKHEYEVYKHLQDFAGVPECYGLADDKYLVLQLVEGTTMQQRPEDEVRYFATMLDYIKQMHDLGVAHFDLKKKTNLLVVEGSTPCLIDLGVAIIKKPGFHPLNHYLFELAKRFDFNAWIRHKYGNRPENIAAEDTQYYNRTGIEIYSYKIKRFYKDRLKPLFRRRDR